MKFSKRDIKHLACAHAVAHTSTYGHKNIKIGARVVDKRGNTYSGSNSNKSSPMQQRFNKRRFNMHFHDAISHVMHAEMAAIKKAINKRADLVGASIYVARVGGKHSEYGMCRPCAACLGAIRAVGIAEIFYTTEQGFAYEQLT